MAASETTGEPSDLLGFPMVPSRKSPPELVPTTIWSFGNLSAFATPYECTPRECTPENDGAVTSEVAQFTSYYLVATERFGYRVVEATSQDHAVAAYLDYYGVNEKIHASARLASNVEIALARQCDEQKPRRNVHYSLPRTPASSRQ